MKMGSRGLVQRGTLRPPSTSRVRWASVWCVGFARSRAVQSAYHALREGSSTLFGRRCCDHSSPARSCQTYEIRFTWANRKQLGLPGASAKWFPASLPGPVRQVGNSAFRGSRKYRSAPGHRCTKPRDTRLQQDGRLCMLSPERAGPAAVLVP